MRRRTALKIVTLGALAANQEGLSLAVGRLSERADWSAGDYKLQFFTEEENAMLDRLMEMIIPADAHSPGAHAAQVSLFADRMVAASGQGAQRHWREGLTLMREEAARSSLAEALAKAAAHEGQPTTDLERFFETLKQLIVNGYYTSSIGIHQDLQYQGNTYLRAYSGCTIKKAVTSDE